MKTVLLILPLLLSGQANPTGTLFCFPSLSWGCSPETAATAADRAGWTEEAASETESGVELVYGLDFYGVESEVLLRFTPRGKKLYAAELQWEADEAPDRLRARLISLLGPPRQDQEFLGITAWTRGMTEVELRRTEESIRLLYADLTLWEEGRKEREKPASE